MQDARVEITDDLTALYIAVDPAGIWAQSAKPHQLITIDSDGQGRAIGIEAIGDPARHAITALAQALLDVPGVSLDALERAVRGTILPHAEATDRPSGQAASNRIRDARVEITDEGAALYVAVDPDGIWAQSAKPHELITVDADRQGRVIGIEAVGDPARQAITALVRSLLDVPAVDREMLELAVRTTVMPDASDDYEQAEAAYAAGDVTASLALHERAHYTRLMTLGSDHPDTLQSLDALVVVTHRRGAWGRARMLAERVLEARRRVLGPEHPTTLESMNNLAVVLRDMGDPNRLAGQLGEEVVAMRRRVLGAEHPDTLQSMNDLVLTRLGERMFEAARKLGEEVVQARTRTLGGDDRGTLQSMNNLGMALHALGRRQAARELMSHALETALRVLPADHPDTRTYRANLRVMEGASLTDGTASPAWWSVAGSTVSTTG